MKKGLDDYGNKGIKNNWRLWQINRIIERIKKPKKDCIILYLVGPNDIDRPLLIRKGFKNNNIIGVDIVKDRIDKIRKCGNLGICHDLIELIGFWLIDPKIDIVIADFCWGFNNRMMGFIVDLIFAPGLSDHSVISINLFRGHDPASTPLREFSKKYINQMYPKISDKHRGVHFYWHYINYYVNVWLKLDKIIKENETKWTMPIDIIESNGIDYWERKALADKILKYNPPAFNTYKSKKNKMDSVVFEVQPIRIDYNILKGDERYKLITKKIAPIKAHRTMRMDH